MEFTPEKKEIVTKVATDALSRLSDIAEAAERALGSSGAISSDALVDPHAANARAALENLSKSSLLVRASHEQLTREPAIARVVVFDSKNQERIYYICRTSPVSGVKTWRVIARLLGDSHRLRSVRALSFRTGKSWKFSNAQSCTPSKRTTNGIRRAQ